MQCSILAFDGLFPRKDNAIIKKLLFHLSEWHALAKLWMHSDESLDWLNLVLKKLAAEIQWFQWGTCNTFKTHELPSEVTARHRQQEHQIRSGGPTTSMSSTAHPKSFNILTYKFHALGDYSRSTQMFSTTDSYTTQIVSGCQSAVAQKRYMMVIPRVNLLTIWPRNFIDIWTKEMSQQH